MNKKGYSAGFTWILGLLMLFALGIGYVILNQVLTVHVSPVADTIIDSSPYLNVTEVIDIKADNNKYMAFWHAMPFVAVFIIIIYIIMSAVRGGEEDARY